jgi:serine/threonine-protein phosphatase PGAM5
LRVRELILIRHGQYDFEDGTLTALGVRQARVTARALRGVNAQALYSSTLVRAKQTAAIVSQELGLRPRASRLICEGMPTHWIERPTAEQRRQANEDRRRIKRAFTKFFRPTTRSRTEVIICHGNIIRFFVCLVLGAKPEAWLRMGTFNCGITTIFVNPKSGKRLLAYNDIRHLPPRLRTMT